jgi:phosphatidylglycerophosphate synthase
MTQFAGDQKVDSSILTKPERKFIDWIVPKIPNRIRTYHLTLLTIPISLFIIIFGYLAKDNINWLWLVSFMIFVQWLTDSLDGSLGKYQGEGLIRWGYYMDHFLDYIFLCAILIGYSLILPDNLKYLQFFVLAIFGAFMVNSYLAFAASNKFRISHMGIGPTEVRIIFILINTMIIIFGKTYIGASLPYILILSTIGLIIITYRTQKEIWQMDKDKKNNL